MCTQVRYKGVDGNQNDVWSSSSSQSGSPTVSFRLQTDGNAVMYVNNGAVWAAGGNAFPNGLDTTNVGSPPHRFWIMDNGDFQIHRYDSSTGAWSTKWKYSDNDASNFAKSGYPTTLGADGELCHPNYDKPSGSGSSCRPQWCVSCPAGQTAVNMDRCEATNCQRGSYLGNAGCVKCPSGKYSSTPAATSAAACKTCKYGTFTQSDGATHCQGCAAGNYFRNSSQDCGQCPGGTFSAQSATACIDCAAGKYSQSAAATATTGPSNCKDCDAGTWSGKAATSCYNLPSCPDAVGDMSADVKALLGGAAPSGATKVLSCGSCDFYVHQTTGTLSRSGICNTGQVTAAQACTGSIDLKQKGINSVAFNTFSGNDFVIQVGTLAANIVPTSGNLTVVSAAGSSAWSIQTKDCGTSACGSYIKVGDEIMESTLVTASVTCSGGCSGCVDSSGSSSGTIRDDNDGTGDYGANTDCEWLIASNSQISLSFTSFHTEKDYDYVYVESCSSSSCDSAVELAKLHGNSANSDTSAADLSTTYTSSTGYLRVRLTSDDSLEYAGFSADWSVGAQTSGGDTFTVKRAQLETKSDSHAKGDAVFRFYHANVTAMTSMTGIDLSQNNISKLDISTFTNNTALRALNLSHNPMSCLPSFEDGHGGCNSLREVSVHHTNLAALNPGDDFEKCDQLRFLRMEPSRLLELTDKTLELLGMFRDCRKRPAKCSDMQTCV